MSADTRHDKLDTMEVKEIPGHAGYRVDSMGGVYGKSGKKLKLFPGTGGYLRFTTYESGSWRQVSVHVMVCLAFHGERPEGAHAAHRNGVTLDNRASNLRWATGEQNEADKRAHDRHTWGERHPLHKLTVPEVLEIRKLRAQGVRLSTLAHRFKVSEATISSVANRKTWRDLS